MSEDKDPRQTEFNWTRARRLKFLDQLELPNVPGASPAKMLAVLRCLESHSRDKTTCRVFVGTIALKVNTTERTIRRALAGLELLGIIDKKRTGRSSMYLIRWADLQDYVPEVVAREAAEMSDQSGHHVLSERTPCPNRADTMSDQIGHHVRSTEAPFETNKETPPPPPEENEWEAVGADLFECGVFRIRDAIEAAKQAGVGPDYVRQCIEFWRSTGGAFGPGGLVERLREAKPYAAPETLWPLPKPLTDREQKAYRLLAAVQEYGVAEQLSESQIRSRFETAARTDPETCRPDQVEMARKYGCPFDEREINRALFEARSTNQLARN